MAEKKQTLILASASPRRQEYLALLDIPYICQAAEVDETLEPCKKHEVITGLCVVAPDKTVHRDFRSTTVQMAQMTEKEIRAYVATGEPRDKAGAYAIQGKGAAMIERIEGCYFNVVGLPIHGTKQLLQKAGYFDETGKDR